LGKISQEAFGDIENKKSQLLFLSSNQQFVIAFISLTH
jgi:hypothetical protein